MLQIHGTCDACRTGRPPVAEGGVTELLFARDALRIAIATERSGLDFYSRAARITSDPRGRRVFEKLAEEEKEHLGTLETRYRELLQQDPQLESRPTFLFFKGAANGLFAAGAEQLAKGVNDREALMIGIKCERGSHRFFKRYGEKFEDSEGKTDLSRVRRRGAAHLELLIREYRALVERQRRRGKAEARNAGRARAQPAPRDRPPSSHHRLRRHPVPVDLIARAAGAGLTMVSVTDHDTIAGLAEARAAGGAPRHAARQRHRDHRRRGGPRRPHAWRTSSILPTAGSPSSCAHSAPIAFAACMRSRNGCATLGCAIDVDALLPPRAHAGAEHRPSACRRRAGGAGHARDRTDAFDRLHRPWPSGVRAEKRPTPDEVIADRREAGGIASLAHPG